MVSTGRGGGGYCSSGEVIIFSCAVLHRFAPLCAVLHRFAPFCAALHRFAPSCAILRLLAIAGPNIWGAQNPCPLFSRSLPKLGGERPLFPLKYFVWFLPEVDASFMLHQHKSHLPPSECATAGGGVKSFCLGDNTRRGKGEGGCVVFFAAADVITGGITRDQYTRRKDDRKGRMDPMSCSS